MFAIVTTNELGGQGKAFVISPSIDFSRAGGAAHLGIFHRLNDGQPTNHILAIELNTAQNFEFDIDGNHVGIDVNGLQSEESALVAYFSDTEGRNIC